MILFADDLEQLRAAHGFLAMMPTRIDLQPTPPSEGNSTEPLTEGAALFVQSDSRQLFFIT